MTMDARDFLVQRAVASEVPRVRMGVSGYFTRPTPDLDPVLFGTPGSRKLDPDIRHWVIETLGSFWETRYYDWRSWTRIWIAGSGVSFQWSADRSPRDLDILLGVDGEKFRYHNPRFNGFSDHDIATMLTDELKHGLWPLTSEVSFQPGTIPYEATWYVNDRSEDIKFINPYAAYDVIADRWSVEPIELDKDWNPLTHFPQGWWDQIHREQATAKAVLQRYASLVKEIKRTDAGAIAHRVNLAVQLRQAVADGNELFMDLHSGRRNAFNPGGQGYMDWFNFRWQAAKRAGLVEALHALAALHQEAREQHEQDLYGHVLTNTETALRTAATVHTVLDSVRA